MNDTIITIDEVEKHISGYLLMRRNMGFKCNTEEKNLKSYIGCYRKAKEVLSEHNITEWCKRRPTDAADTWQRRCTYIRQFLVYLTNMGLAVRVPPVVRTREKSSFTPYIYSSEEIIAIYAVCDNLKAVSTSTHNGLFAMPVLVRMLAGTGMRISEALSLMVHRVVLDQGYVILHACKNGKDRIVPLSETLLEVCKLYQLYRSRLPQVSDYFFVQADGCPLSYKSAAGWWRKILHGAGILHRGDLYGPRIHDLRHLFCIESALQQAKNGANFYTILPVLAAYAGHTNIASTGRYLRLTSEMYPEIMSKTEDVCEYIFPRMKSHEY
ncbi:tyrosine-type recombinase/integrase [Arcticibacter tournemirensis]